MSVKSKVNGKYITLAETKDFSAIATNDITALNSNINIVFMEGFIVGNMMTITYSFSIRNADLPSGTDMFSLPKTCSWNNFYIPLHVYEGDFVGIRLRGNKIVSDDVIKTGKPYRGQFSFPI